MYEKCSCLTVLFFISFSLLPVDIGVDTVCMRNIAALANSLLFLSRLSVLPADIGVGTVCT